MPISRSSTTVALLVGTVATAAGLNLSVLGLNSPQGGTDAAEATPSASAAVDPGAQAAALPPPLDGSGTAALGSAEPVALVVAGGEPAPPGPVVESTPTPETRPATVPPPPLATNPPGSPPPSTVATTDAPTSAAPATTQTTTSRPPATSLPASTEIVTDEFAGIATIVVAVHDGGRLELVSVTPVPGMAHRVEDRSDTRIKIKFRPLAGGEESEWKIRLDDGEPNIDKEL